MAIRSARRKEHRTRRTERLLAMELGQPRQRRRCPGLCRAASLPGGQRAEQQKAQLVVMERLKERQAARTRAAHRWRQHPCLLLLQPIRLVPLPWPVSRLEAIAATRLPANCLRPSQTILHRLAAFVEDLQLPGCNTVASRLRLASPTTRLLVVSRRHPAERRAVGRVLRCRACCSSSRPSPVGSLPRRNLNRHLTCL